MRFPEYRSRRSRKNQYMRNLISETTVSVDDLIYPIFIVPGRRVKEEINSMPGIYRNSIENAVKEIKQIDDLGIRGV
ncbi:porphobilinogen synthase, partial [Desulfobacterota bacterium AH_259_B03_O07]|nr:porphobilinogen synthase [Desulfobacterota bacterium AH_259_B03_O07]